MSEQKNNDQAKKPKRRIGRSPAYPTLSVDKALSQSKALHDQEGDYEAPIQSAMTAWGYSPKSSGGRQTLATLKYFGLIDIVGGGDDRKIKTSKVARKIHLYQREDQTEKHQMIRRIALTPSAHKTLHAEYPNGLASDGTVLHFLVNDHGFAQDAAKDLLAEYKRSAEFASIYQPDNSLDKNGDLEDTGTDEDGLPKVSVGDKIHCTVHGANVFDPPATVLGISEDELWVFTDKSNSGSPIKDVTVIEHASTAPKDGLTPPPIPENLRAPAQTPPAGVLEDKAHLDEGVAILRWPETLSKDSVYELEYWIEGIMKRAKRRAGIVEKKKGGGEASA